MSSEERKELEDLITVMLGQPVSNRQAKAIRIIDSRLQRIEEYLKARELDDAVSAADPYYGDEPPSAA